MLATTRALIALERFTRGGAFPYTIERCVSCESGPVALYVVTARFHETDDYDVRVYAPASAVRGSDYDACWVAATGQVLSELKRQERLNRKVTWKLLPRVFEGFPSPPVPNSFCSGEDWSPILNAVLRSRVW